MAKMIIAGEELEMPVWLKGRLLAQTIETTSNPNIFTCESGTSNKRYRVITDGTVALSCSCPAIGACAHKIAVEKYVREQVGEMEAIANQIIAEEKANKERAIAREAFGQFFQAMAIIAAQLVRAEELAAIEEVERHLAEERKRKQAPLNGNQGFSLLKR